MYWKLQANPWFLSWTTKGSSWHHPYRCWFCLSSLPIHSLKLLFVESLFCFTTERPSTRTASIILHPTRFWAIPNGTLLATHYEAVATAPGAVMVSYQTAQCHLKFWCQITSSSHTSQAASLFRIWLRHFATCAPLESWRIEDWCSPQPRRNRSRGTTMLPASKYRLSALSEIDSEILPVLTVLVAIGKSAQMAQISLAVFVVFFTGCSLAGINHWMLMLSTRCITTHTSSQRSTPPRFMTAMLLGCCKNLWDT